jgi:hypothetical protein
VLLIPASFYEANRQLATFQMDAAGAFSKPIIAIQSFGATVVLHKSLKDRAADIVDWNERAIADAVRRLARHEVTARWEVIEFKLD